MKLQKGIKRSFAAGMVAMLLLTMVPAAAQVSIPPSLAPYSQDFDSLANTGTSNPWVDNVTLEGWYGWKSNGGPLTTYRAGDGSSNAGALYSFGTISATERALGSIASGGTSAGNFAYGVRLRNDSGHTLDGFSITYTGEQWRCGGNTTQQKLDFAYQAGLSLTNPISGTWTDIDTLDFWGPIHDAAAGALDGNNPANRVTLHGTITVTLDPGQEIMFRWYDTNDTGNDHGLAVDDLHITPTAEMTIVLGIAKSVSPSHYVPYHGNVTYTVVLRNDGNMDDPSVYLTDTLPIEVTFDHWVVQPAGAQYSGGVITWAGVASGTTAYTFTFVAQHGGDYGDVVTNTAEYSGSLTAGSAAATFDVETLTGDVTFVYHDLEDVVHVGEPVYLAGDFNGWSTTATTMTADAGYDTFTVTVPGLPTGSTQEYKYVVKSAGDQWDWLNTSNRSHTVAGTETVHDYRNVAVSWARLQWPPTLLVRVGYPTDMVYGRVLVNNVTNPPGEGRGLRAEVGYGDTSNPPDWAWSPMVYNVDDGPNDEFRGVMTPTAAGVYSYSVRFTGNWGTDGTDNPNLAWGYGDLNGTPFSLDQTGVMTAVQYDLAVAKSVTPTLALVREGVGQLVTYTIQIDNLSTVTDTTVVTVSDVLPPYFAYVGDDSGVGHSGSGTVADPLLWTLTTPIPHGGSLAFHLVVSATDAITASGRYTNEVTIATAPPDWVGENDTAAAGLMVYRVVPIATARAGLDGQVFAVEGRVIYAPFTFGTNEWGIQDDSGGISVYYSPPPAVALGDQVVLVATRGSFNNQEQLATPVYYYAWLGSGLEVDPISHDTGEVATGAIEGWLVRLQGTVLNFNPADCGQAGNFQFDLDDGSGAATIYVDIDTGITLCATVADGDYLRVDGFSTQYQALYEVKPRRPADILLSPHVVSTTPADGATDVPVGTNVQATFNMPMTAATVNTTTFYLEGPGGVTVTAAVTYDPGTYTALLDPAANLANATLYTAHLTTGIESAAGMPLPAEYTWSFTTAAGAQPDLHNSFKTAEPMLVPVDTVLTYTIRLINTGAADANTRITDVVPLEVSVITPSLPAGMVYENGQLLWSGVVPQGTSLPLAFQVRVHTGLAADQPITNVVWIDDGVHDPFTKEAVVWVLGLPDIAVTPLSLHVDLAPAGTASRTVSISNLGNADLNWELAENPPETWLGEVPTSGTIPPAGTTNVGVSFSAIGLPVGTYNTTLEISSDDPGEPLVVVQVTLVVTTECIPAANATFTWEPTSPTTGQAITFHGSATGLEPISYTWNFGDDTPVQTGATVLHTYALSNTYTVVMTATNACGSAHLAQNIRVTGPSQPTWRVFLPLVVKGFAP